MKYFFTLVALVIAATTFAQDSLNMSLLYRYDPDTIPTNGSREFNECWGYVTCDGQEIAVLGSSGRVHFFDVTDPVNAYEIAWFTGGSITTWRDMKSYKDRVYSVCDSCDEGLMIFDMSEAPDSVTLSNQTTEFWGRAHNIFIDIATGLAYGVGTDSLNQGVVVLDLNMDLDNPTLVSNTILPGGYVHDMYIHDGKAFVNHGGNGLYAYDFADPANPLLLGTMTDYPESGYNHSCWLNAEENTLVLCDETFNRGVKTVNVEDPSDMFVEQVFRSKLLDPIDTASIPHNPLIIGDIAFVSYYHDGVAAFDISDPADVQKVAFYDTEPNNTNYGGFTGAWGVFPFLPSGNILVSDMTRGLHVLSLENVDLGAIHGGYETILRPQPTIVQAGLNQICEGDSVLVSTEDEGDLYIWRQIESGEEFSGLNDSINIIQAGSYQLTIADCHCLGTSLDTAFVEIIEFPDVSITVDGETEFCKGDSTVLSVPEGAQSYVWVQDGDLILDQGNALHVFESGIYRSLAANGECSSSSEDIEITVFETLIFPLDVSGNMLESIEAVDYQWYLNDEPIAGAVAQTYEATEDGEYFVEITDSNGCKNFSEKEEIIISSVSQIDLLRQFAVFPNPVKEALNIQLTSESPAEYQLSLQTLDGKILKTIQQTIVQTKVVQMSVKDLSAGVYFIQIANDRGVATQKLIKQ